MTLTDHSDVYGALGEGGINHVVDHMRHKRPALLNYGTARVVAGVTDAAIITELTNPAALRAVLLAERRGKNRSTVVQTLNERLREVHPRR